LRILYVGSAEPFRVNMEGDIEGRSLSDQSINIEKYRRLVKSYIDLVSITGC
jgi:hypothetical protein